MMAEIYDSRNACFIPVKVAAWIKIEGWEDLDFFIHRSPWDGQKTWLLSETSTGCRVAVGKTQSEATKNATTTFAKIPANYRKQIADKAQWNRHLAGI